MRNQAFYASCFRMTETHIDPEIEVMASAVAADQPLGHTNWRLLQYFNLYRVGIAGLASLGSLFIDLITPFGKTDPVLFQIVAVTYFIVSLFGLRITYIRQPDFETQASVFAFSDVAFVTLLTHASGGLASSLGLFLVVAVTGASLLLNKRMTIFVASLASVAALIQHSWGLLTGTDTYYGTISQGYPQVGALGLGLFTASVLGYTLAQRLRLSEAIADQRGADISNLSRINALIIERMQAGVLVCDNHLMIKQYNTRAGHFFDLPEQEPGKPEWRLADLSPDLEAGLLDWLAYPSRKQLRPVVARNGQAVVPRFEPISENLNDGVLIFLSDVAALKQQAQQLKMAALARLTASIAHEIRNPLGAISNAAQLLGETVSANSDETRLSQIILDHCKRMNRIIENITQLARRDRLNQERIQLHDWLGHFIGQFVDEHSLPKDTLILNGGTDVRACMDPNQLTQVVTNLVQNGLRHSRKGSKAVIELELGVDSKSGLPYLDITDSGEGVPREIAENIFDPFFTTASTGTGLGLYISRELCESNGGGLHLVSSYTEGARFRIIFSPADECA